MQKSWDAYIVALSKQSNPSSNIDAGIPFPTSGGPSSGFLELPKTDNLKKYDAMNPHWDGIEINLPTNIYKPEFQSIQNGFTQNKSN
jgi:hypothetical protein